MSEFPAYQYAPQNPGPAEGPAWPLRTRSIIAIAFVALGVLLSTVTSVLELAGVDLDSLLGITAAASFTLLLAGVAFIRWEHWARKNLDAFGVAGLKWSPGWSIGGWLIPLGNLVIPLLVLNEIDTATAARAARVPQDALGAGRSRATFIVWAVTWTLSTVSSYVLFALDASAATAVVAFSTIVELVAGVAVILLILQITGRQEMIRRARHGAPQPPGNLPPPVWPGPAV